MAVAAQKKPKQVVLGDGKKQRKCVDQVNTLEIGNEINEAQEPGRVRGLFRSDSHVMRKELGEVDGSRSVARTAREVSEDRNPECYRPTDRQGTEDLPGRAQRIVMARPAHMVLHATRIALPSKSCDNVRSSPANWASRRLGSWEQFTKM